MREAGDVCGVGGEGRGEVFLEKQVKKARGGECKASHHVQRTTSNLF